MWNTSEDVASIVELYWATVTVFYVTVKSHSLLKENIVLDLPRLKHPTIQKQSSRMPDSTHF